MSENRRFHKTVSIIVSMLFLINNISWQAPDITQDMQKEDTLKALSARLDGQTADTVGQSLLETKVLAVNSPAASVETRIGFSAKFSSKPFSAGNTISPADLSDELLKTIGIKRYNIKEVRRYSKGYIIIFTTGAISAEGGSAYILSPDKELIAGADYLVGSESSPDNRYVAFIHKDYVSLYDFDSKKPTEAILVYSEEDIVAEYKVTFSPDSSYVLIKSSWGHQLYKYNVYDLQHPEKPIKIDNLSQWLPNHIEVNFDPTSKNLEFKIKRVGYPGEEWKEPLPQKTALTSPKPSSAGTEVVDTGRFKFTVDQELLALLEKQDTSGNIKAVTAKINQIMSGIKDNSIPRSEIYSRFAYAFDETSEGIRRVDIPKGEGEISSLFLVEARLPGHAEIEFIAILAYQYYLDKRYNFPFIFGVVTGITPDNKIGYFGDYHGNLLAAAMKFAKTLKTSSAGMVEVDEFLRSQGVCALISPSVENAEELIKIIADAEYPYLGVEIAFRGDRDRVLSLIKFASEYSKSKIVVAAGTVLDGVDAFDAITNGASLIVTPGLTLTKADIMMFHNLGAKVIMGAGSPQEAQRAKNRGADAIKAFPYNIKGDHMKALKGPLPSKYHDSADKYVRLIKGGKDTLATFTYIYEWLRTNPTKSKRFKLPLTEKDLVKAIRSAIPSGAPLFITGGVLAEDIKAGLLDDLKIGAALSVKDINEAKKLAEVMKGRTAKTSSAGNIKIEALNLAIEQTEEKPFVRLIQILNRDLTSSIVDTTGSLSSELIRNELRKFVGLDHIYIDTFVTLDNPSKPDKERLYLFWANIQNKPYLCMLVRKDASDGVKQYEFTPYRVTNITDYDINTIVESLRIGGVTEILTRDTWFKNILHQRRISSSAIAQLEKPKSAKPSSAGKELEKVIKQDLRNIKRELRKRIKRYLEERYFAEVASIIKELFRDNADIGRRAELLQGMGVEIINTRLRYNRTRMNAVFETIKNTKRLGREFINSEAFSRLPSDVQFQIASWYKLRPSVRTKSKASAAEATGVAKATSAYKKLLIKLIKTQRFLKRVIDIVEEARDEVAALIDYEAATHAEIPAYSIQGKVLLVSIWGKENKRSELRSIHLSFKTIGGITVPLEGIPVFLVKVGTKRKAAETKIVQTSPTTAKAVFENVPHKDFIFNVGKPNLRNLKQLYAELNRKAGIDAKPSSAGEAADPAALDIHQRLWEAVQAKGPKLLAKLHTSKASIAYHIPYNEIVQAISKYASNEKEIESLIKAVVKRTKIIKEEEITGGYAVKYEVKISDKDRRIGGVPVPNHIPQLRVYGWNFLTKEQWEYTDFAKRAWKYFGFTDADETYHADVALVPHPSIPQRYEAWVIRNFNFIEATIGLPESLGSVEDIISAAKPSSAGIEIETIADLVKVNKSVRIENSYFRTVLGEILQWHKANKGISEDSIRRSLNFVSLVVNNVVAFSPVKLEKDTFLLLLGPKAKKYAEIFPVVGVVLRWNGEKVELLESVTEVVDKEKLKDILDKAPMADKTTEESLRTTFYLEVRVMLYKFSPFETIANLVEIDTSESVKDKTLGTIFKKVARKYTDSLNGKAITITPGSVRNSIKELDTAGKYVVSTVELKKNTVLTMAEPLSFQDPAKRAKRKGYPLVTAVVVRLKSGKSPAVTCDVVTEIVDKDKLKDILDEAPMRSKTTEQPLRDRFYIETPCDVFKTSSAGTKLISGLFFIADEDPYISEISGIKDNNLLNQIYSYCTAQGHVGVADVLYAAKMIKRSETNLIMAVAIDLYTVLMVVEGLQSKEDEIKTARSKLVIIHMEPRHAPDMGPVVAIKNEARLRKILDKIKKDEGANLNEWRWTKLDELIRRTPAIPKSSSAGQIQVGRYTIPISTKSGDYFIAGTLAEELSKVMVFLESLDNTNKGKTLIPGYKLDLKGLRRLDLRSINLAGIIANSNTTESLLNMLDPRTLTYLGRTNKGLTRNSRIYAIKETAKIDVWWILATRNDSQIEALREVTGARSLYANRIGRVDGIPSFAKSSLAGEVSQDDVVVGETMVTRWGKMPVELIEKMRGSNRNWSLGINSSTQSVTFTVCDFDTKDIIFQWQEKYKDEFYKSFNAPDGSLPHPDLKRHHTDPLMLAAALDKGMKELSDAFKNFEWDINNIRTISGAGQQHGTVYYNKEADRILSSLDPTRPLAEQIKEALAWNEAPIWRDKTTEPQQTEAEEFFGGPEALRQKTGSRGELRFGLLQIMKLYKEDKDTYDKTDTIVNIAGYNGGLLSGVSRFPFDYGDGAGANAMDIHTNQWLPEIDKLVPDLRAKLPDIKPTNYIVGNISKYWTKYGFSPDVKIVNWTGDNPSAMVGQGIVGKGQVGISLGTSFTIYTYIDEAELGKTLQSKIGHVFGEPTGKWMKLVCFQNGGLALEKIRDGWVSRRETIIWLNTQGIHRTQFANEDDWEKRIDLMRWQIFNERVSEAPVGNNGAMMITQNTQEEAVRIPYIEDKPFTRNLDLNTADRSKELRAAAEGQIYFLKWIADQIGLDVKEINLTGGSSKNPVIRQIIADIFNAKVNVLKKSYFPNEPVSLGAAINAAKAYTDSVKGQAMPWGQAIKDLVALDSEMTTSPNANSVVIYQKYYPEFDKLVKEAMAAKSSSAGKAMMELNKELRDAENILLDVLIRQTTQVPGDIELLNDSLLTESLQALTELNTKATRLRGEGAIAADEEELIQLKIKAQRSVIDFARICAPIARVESEATIIVDPEVIPDQRQRQAVVSMLKDERLRNALEYSLSFKDKGQVTKKTQILLLEDAKQNTSDPQKTILISNYQLIKDVKLFKVGVIKEDMLLPMAELIAIARGLLSLNKDNFEQLFPAIKKMYAKYTNGDTIASELEEKLKDGSWDVFDIIITNLPSVKKLNQEDIERLQRQALAAQIAA